jgi:hypothetical protein
MELVGSGSGPRSVDTLFGFNIIGKSMFTVRESMRVYARASVPYKGDTRGTVISPLILTNASKKLHWDEVFLLRGREGGAISRLTEALVAHAAAS